MSNTLPTIEEEDDPENRSRILSLPSLNASFTTPTKNSSKSLTITKSQSKTSDLSSKRGERKGFESNLVIGDTSKEKVVPKKRSIITHAKINNITLTEDCFGIYKKQNGDQRVIQRFTWTSSSKVSVQIITYGARILSIKLPDKRGIVDDVVLGFGDLAGYLYYDKFYFGATIGRVTNKIKSGTFNIDNASLKVSTNRDQHHADGGFVGLDKVIWNSYVNGTKVILTCASPDNHEGFPGALMLTIAFELTPRNEFCIDMEAKTTKPTLVNLSNLCYFNLGGHHSGSKELSNHSVLINANCYTLMDDDDFPSGKIMNVVHTKYNFTTAKFMRNYLGGEPDSGFDQNLCVNRGVAQGNCFVARAVHVGNGRMLEIYSNQRGVRFETANDFGLGVVAPPVDAPPPEDSDKISDGIVESAGVFVLLNMIYETMNAITEFNDTNFVVVHQLMKQLSAFPITLAHSNRRRTMSFADPDFCIFGFLNVLEMSLMHVKTILPQDIDNITSWTELKLVVDDMLQKYADFDNIEALEAEDEEGDDTNVMEESVSPKDSIERGSALDGSALGGSALGGSALGGSALGGSDYRNANSQSVEKLLSSTSRSLRSAEKMLKSQRSSSLHTLDKLEKSGSVLSAHQNEKVGSSSKTSNVVDRIVSFISKSPIGSSKGSTSSSTYKEAEVTNIALTSQLNVIPKYYQDGRIHGKNNAIYKRYGGMVFQTQNYPDAIHHDNFPSPILRPGQTYKHTIVYKFSVKKDDLSKLKTKRKCY